MGETGKSRDRSSQFQRVWDFDLADLPIEVWVSFDVITFV
jgi:hypothetical protein